MLIEMDHLLCGYLCIVFLFRVWIHRSRTFLWRFLCHLSVCLISIGWASWLEAGIKTSLATAVKWESLMRFLIFLYRHMTQSWRFLAVSLALLMVFLKIIPFFLWESLLNLLDDLLQRDLTSALILEVINKVIVATQLEYISQDHFQIAFIWLSKLLAIVLIEILHNLSLINLDQLASVYVNTFARLSIHNLLYLNDQLILPGVRVIVEFMSHRYQHINQLLKGCILR